MTSQDLSSAPTPALTQCVAGAVFALSRPVLTPNASNMDANYNLPPPPLPDQGWASHSALGYCGAVGGGGAWCVAEGVIVCVRVCAMDRCRAVGGGAASCAPYLPCTHTHYTQHTCHPRHGCHKCPAVQVPREWQVRTVTKSCSRYEAHDLSPSFFLSFVLLLSRCLFVTHAHVRTSPTHTTIVLVRVLVLRGSHSRPCTYPPIHLCPRRCPTSISTSSLS